MKNFVISALNLLFILSNILLILFYYSYKSPAFSILPEHIGKEDKSYAEFWDPNPSPEVVEYNLGDDWTKFPHKLTNKAHEPHILHIIFDTDSHTGPFNLVLGVTTDTSEQDFSLFFDGSYIGKGKVQTGPFRHITFWLGEIPEGSHRITITNDSDPDPESSYGIFFDFLQLVFSPESNTINIPGDYASISEGIQNATPGDTIYVNKGVYNENIILKPGILLVGEDPHGTIIDGGGKTVISGSYQGHVKSLTIRNGGMNFINNQGAGIMVNDDFLRLSNNIISSCAIGIFLTGHDLSVVNNTMVLNKCNIYIQRSDPNSPIPSLRCENNIFSDFNCSIYVLTDESNKYAIDYEKIPHVIEVFSYNNVWTKFDSNIDLFKFGKGNIKANPCFADPDGNDYHLLNYSPCIDAGDPNSGFSEEPEDNGKRVNLGAFGNTPYAARTLDSDNDGAKDYIEGTLDRDQDGKEDWADSQTSVLKTALGDERIWISLDTDTNAVIGKLRAIDTQDPLISLADLSNTYIFYGFWRFEIELDGDDDEITVDMHLPQKLFEFMEYISYDPNDNTWEPYQITKDPSNSKISMVLSDGGTTDLDKTLNGSISHIGATGITPPFHEAPDSITCFIHTIERMNMEKGNQLREKITDIEFLEY